MENFLSKAAKLIVSKKYWGPDAVVILPNRRSEVFLKREIINISESVSWMPDFLPIDEFFQKITGIRKADNISTWFELYEVYKETSNDGTIDDLFTWAPMILNDFSDIDNSLANPQEVYGELSAVKAIELWNPSTGKLTESQQKYIRFFNSMYDFYIGLKDRLLKMSTGYQGLINRYLAENPGLFTTNMKWKNILVVGINALTEAEITAFRYLNEKYNTEFLWDLDNYYFDSNGKTKHEAGRQISRAIQKLKLDLPADIESNLTDKPKKIRVLGTPKNIGQIKYVCQELSSIEKLTGTNTAIVLGDEKLLIPLLNSLPDNHNIKYNLTLGYPLADSHIDHFFESWINLIESIDYKNKSIRSDHLLILINNPVTRSILFSEEHEFDLFKSEILGLSINYISFDEIITITDRISKSSAKIIHGILLNNTQKIHQKLNNLKNLLTSSSGNYQNILIDEQVKILIQVLSRLTFYSEKYSNNISLRSIKKIGRQIIGQQTVSLIGEPLHGIQIMGMLETRTLDFDNIYILSVNEGVIPKTGNIDTFIPFDIRRELNLPLPQDKTDIYSYHFFRLLQRCSNITLVYNSDAEIFGGGEKSRFILQLENEIINKYKNISYSSETIVTELQNSNLKENNEGIVIDKSEDIMKRIKRFSETGFSASLFISYITCQLKFYYQHVLRIKSESSVSTSIEPNKFGTVIHDTLEDIYKPWTGTKIDPEKLKLTDKEITDILIVNFKKHTNLYNLNSGKNFLFFEIAINYVKRFLAWDRSSLKTAGTILFGTEDKLEASIQYNDQVLSIKGTIDKIEKLVESDVIRITDYKSGKVTSSDLKITDFDELFSNPDRSKAFQIIYYSWLYSLKTKVGHIEPGIISIRNISNGFIPLQLIGFKGVSECYDDFHNGILKLVDEMFDDKIPLSQTTDLKRCEYCDYNSLCNRKKE